MFCELKEPAPLEFFVWDATIGHPRVKLDPLNLEIGIIGTERGPKKIRMGQYVVRFGANNYRIFGKEVFHSRFKVLDNDFNSGSDSTQGICGNHPGG